MCCSLSSKFLSASKIITYNDVNGWQLYASFCRHYSCRFWTKLQSESKRFPTLGIPRATHHIEFVATTSFEYRETSDRALIKCMQHWHNDENGSNDIQSEKLSFILIKNYCFRHSAFKYAYLEQVSWNNMNSSHNEPVKIARLLFMCSISSNYE